MRMEIRKRKRLRQTARVVFCAVQLAVTLLGFHVLGLIFEPLVQTEAANVHYASGIWTGVSEDNGKPVVCIDAGHGGRDNGSSSGQRMEKDDNLKMAQAVAEYLATQGADVVMTRTGDTYLELSERCEIANGRQVDYFVSLHRNAGNGTGVEIWVYSGVGEKTSELAENILTELDTAGIQRNRGVREVTQGGGGDNYFVNTHTEMPSCIVEMGFIGNARDNELFDEKLRDYAAAIGDGILETYDKYKDAPRLTYISSKK